ncbi:alpha-amylase/4-alpha-glucanotransferase domain-containing protein [Caminibacter sp.]
MLAFGIHLHQPVDNLKEAVDNAVEKCYYPLFETLSKYPEFKFALHISGWLFEKFKNEYTEVFENIKKCNVEFFSGGFYEPILASIPEEDRIIQIKKLNEFIKENFLTAPKNLWLTERVWESGIIKSLNMAGIEGVVVDDYHFLTAGFDLGELEGAYFTEEEGIKIKLYPISKKLRYKIPFSKPKEAVELIKTYKNAIYFDDGEKFGLWPNTYEWVYEKKWLEEFIERVLEEVEVVRFEDIEVLGYAYLPNVSYYEMGEWSLRSQDAIELEKIKNSFDEDFFERVGVKFIKGSIWKNFLVKYPESNRIHKRMLYFSKKKKSENLLKLQTNDVLWHGIFGGIYLPVLRDNAYRFISYCEKENDLPQKEISDFDFDGRDEMILRNKRFIFIFKDNELIELLDKKKDFNYQNVISRYFEHYHSKIKTSHSKKEIATIHEMDYEISDELKKEMIFDDYVRNSFILRSLNKKISADEFKKNEYKEVESEKRIEFNLNETLEFEIEIDRGILGIEFNFHFAHIDEVEVKEFEDRIEIIDKFLNNKIIIHMKAEWRYFKLNTLSLSEKGFELMNQGMSFLAVCEGQKVKGFLEVVDE